MGKIHAGQHSERMPGAARPGRRSGAAALSAVLAQQPACFDGKKVSVVDKNITMLGSLPDLFAQVKVR
jgi:hypothetical protein